MLNKKAHGQKKLTLLLINILSIKVTLILPGGFLFINLLRVRSYCDGDGINFHYFDVAMKWVQHPIVLAMVMEQTGIMETDGGVHTVTAVENIKSCCCCRSVNEP